VIKESDFVIKLGSYSWTVPAAPLVETSEFFRALVAGGYRVRLPCLSHLPSIPSLTISHRSSSLPPGTTQHRPLSHHRNQESLDRTADLQDDNPLAFARLLVWALHDAYPLYASAMTPSGLSVALWRLVGHGLKDYHIPVLLTGEDVIDTHIDVFVVADKYGVAGLRRYCVKRVREVMVGSGLGREGRGDLVWKVVERVKTIDGCAEELEGLVRGWLLYRLERYKGDDRFEEYVREDGEFAWEVVKRLRFLGTLGEGGGLLYGLDVRDEAA
jgi:hypothetical protein